jgi:N-acetylglutamate synthase-like GNAT family acetyltransferase
MNIRLLNKKTEIEAVNNFMPFPVTAGELPGHTYCAVVKDKIVAIAALRLMEGEICCIDSMATNPNFESTIRHEALDCLTKTILELAKNLGFKKVFAYTKEPSIIERAERHGFVVTKQKIITKEI